MVEKSATGTSNTLDSTIVEINSTREPIWQSITQAKFNLGGVSFKNDEDFQPADGNGGFCELFARSSERQNRF